MQWGSGECSLVHDLFPRLQQSALVLSPVHLEPLEAVLVVLQPLLDHLHLAREAN